MAPSASASPTKPSTTPPTASPLPAESTSCSNTAALPPASTFDILPLVHTLLSRLVPPLESTEPALEPQHLATEASALKIRLGKAKAAVAALPDVDRTTAEQEREMRRLEERVARQQEVLRGLGQKIRETGREGPSEDDDRMKE